MLSLVELVFTVRRPEEIQALRYKSAMSKWCDTKEHITGNEARVSRWSTRVLFFNLLSTVILESRCTSGRVLGSPYEGALSLSGNLTTRLAACIFDVMAVTSEKTYDGISSCTTTLFLPSARVDVLLRSQVAGKKKPGMFNSTPSVRRLINSWFRKVLWITGCYSYCISWVLSSFPAVADLAALAARLCAMEAVTLGSMNTF